MRVGIAILLIFILLTPTAPKTLAEEYSPKSLAVSVYADGTTEVVYGVDVNPTLVKVQVMLFGNTFNDLLVTNENNIPLITSESGSTITVDSLGAATLTFTYTTAELTSKIGILWTLNITSPTNLLVTLPTGAIIVSMSQIPLNLKTIGERDQVTLPPGDTQVSYVVSITAAKDHADTVIQDAETTIKSIKAKEVITTEADTLLSQAKTAFASAEYLSSEQLAAKAKASAVITDTIAEAADSAIQRAAAAIQTANNEGRISTTTLADEKLSSAKLQYTSGDYTDAKNTADQAYESALSSKPLVDNTLLIAGVIIAIIVFAFAVIYYNRKRGNVQVEQATPTQSTVKKSDEAAVNLEAIWKRNPQLRVDDKEVLRFLAERNGEVFANEIRDRFDIPRTSAWRMIRRLITMGIVEERKIGNQSLIHVVKKYREAQG